YARDYWVRQNKIFRRRNIGAIRTAFIDNRTAAKRVKPCKIIRKNVLSLSMVGNPLGANSRQSDVCSIKLRRLSTSAVVTFHLRDMVAQCSIAPTEQCPSR